ncbi:MATE family efflux transporter [Flammeovirga aprica]|uniref:Multidrug export protein MepA n=1 Tax=Flammeovirga aprica JL-4 TaxID=694437 RepID=A0A7X9XC64_9BACT|nr:MATE family efflux transporter [Flammeovirga aprica]NME71425.1 MATE family efflux transporter [Flammeovirga aprica JL-4]
MGNNKVLQGSVLNVFLSFSIPTVLGMLAVTSAGIIDGMFVGNYVGTEALAAISLCAPIFSLLFGLPILFSTGGEVFCGKFIGEGNLEKAQKIFTNIIILVGIISCSLTVIGLFFVEDIAVFLGADPTIQPLVVTYLQIIIGMSPVLSCYAFTYFTRVDGLPNLSFVSLLLVAVTNTVLDYLFIVQLDWGVKGAALGTSMSYFVLPVLLLPHFLRQKGKLKFKFTGFDWKILKDIAYNGSSEFFSELSGGFLFYLINLQMMKYYGTVGVAAYAIVGYLMYFMIMLCYGMSDALKSIVSVNFGAKLMDRVKDFLTISLTSAVLLGGILALLTTFFVEQYIDLFLEDDRVTTRVLTEQFTLSAAPILVILGVNVLLSAFFTSLHHPKPSLIISLLRTLIFPVSLVLLLTHFFGGEGVIDAIVLSEVLTLCVSGYLYWKHLRKI